jgi:hypothetical protein
MSRDGPHDTCRPNLFMPHRPSKPGWRLVAQHRLQGSSSPQRWLERHARGGRRCACVAPLSGCPGGSHIGGGNRRSGPQASHSASLWYRTRGTRAHQLAESPAGYLVDEHGVAFVEVRIDRLVLRERQAGEGVASARLLRMDGGGICGEFPTNGGDNEGAGSAPCVFWWQ